MSTPFDKPASICRKLLPFNLLVIAVLLVIGCGLTAYSQGTVNFSNVGSGGSINAPVYESDGVTKLSGSQFTAELFAGPNANNLAAIAMIGFAGGTQAGYFFGGVQSINSVAGGDTAWIQVDVWNTANGASFPQAQASGLPDSWWQSSLFTVVTGNLITGAGPTPAAPLTGLGTSPVYLNSVPEPSTLALVGLGGASALFYVRRRKA
jgi:hypothetical protein